MTTVRRQSISWRPDGGSRLYGAFAGYTADGLIKVRRGPTIYKLKPNEITWEIG